jgi:hypothetical protein
MLSLSEDEKQKIDEELTELTAESSTQRADMIRSLQGSVGNVQERLSRVADAYLDGVLERSILQTKQSALLAERAELEERLAGLKSRDDLFIKRLRDFTEFATSMESVYRAANPFTRQQMLRKVAARITVMDKTVTLTFNPVFSVFAERQRFRGMECNGVSTEMMPSSKADPDRAATVTTIQKDPMKSLLDDSCESGCPPQGILRTLLLEMAAELREPNGPLNDQGVADSRSLL